MSTAAAVILMREKKVVSAFREANATSPESARTLEQLGVRAERAVIRLKRRSVLRETAGGRCYLDEAAWSACRRTRVIRVASLLGIVAAVGLVAWYLTAR